MQTAKLLGGAEVVAIDVAPAKEAAARQFGADRFLTSPEGEYDVVVECSGAPAAIDGALSITAPGDIVPERDIPAIVEHVLAGRLDVDGVAGRVWPLAEIEDAVAAMRAGEVVRSVLDLS